MRPTYSQLKGNDRKMSKLQDLIATWREHKKTDENQKKKKTKTKHPKRTACPIGRPNFDESRTYVLEKLQAVEIPRGLKSDKAHLLRVENLKALEAGFTSVIPLIPLE